MVECLTRDRGAAGSRLAGATVVCPWAIHIYLNIVLAQPRKTRPYITENLLMGRKETNQTNKSNQPKHMLWVHKKSASMRRFF